MPIKDFEVGDITTEQGTIKDFKASTEEDKKDKVWTAKYVIEDTYKTASDAPSCVIYVDKEKFSEKKKGVKNIAKSNEFVFNACTVKPKMEITSTSPKFVSGLETDLIKSGDTTKNPEIILKFASFTNLAPKRKRSGCNFGHHLDFDDPVCNVDLTKDMITLTNCRIVTFEKTLIEAKKCDTLAPNCPVTWYLDGDTSKPNPEAQGGDGKPAKCKLVGNNRDDTKQPTLITGKGCNGVTSTDCFKPEPVDYSWTIKVEPIAKGKCTIQIKGDKYKRREKEIPLMNQASEVFEWTYDGGNDVEKWKKLTKEIYPEVPW